MAIDSKRKGKAGGARVITYTTLVDENTGEVLSQVETQNAEIGLVYATDAASSDKVEVVAECDNSLLATPVLYPIGRVSTTKHKDEADSLIKFLKSDKALKVFKKYGFKKGE